MSRYFFSCEQGHFPVPDGESHVGSDSSCPICIRGEGVLPVHAYIKSSGDRVLIRPASQTARIYLDGRPILGPQLLRRHQILMLGSIGLRVDVAGEPRTRWLGYRRIRMPLYALGVCLTLGLLCVMLRMLVFTDIWVKDKLAEYLGRALQREPEDIEIESVELRLLDGMFRLNGLSISNEQYWTHSVEEKILSVKAVEARIEKPWLLLQSWGRWNARGLSIRLVEPELNIQRIDNFNGPISNLDGWIRDLKIYLENLGSERLQLGFAELEGVFEIDNGVIRLNDKFTQPGTTSLENISVRIRNNGFGQSCMLEQFKIEMVGRDEQAKVIQQGSIELAGHLSLIDEQGRIEFDRIGTGDFAIRFEAFDLARLCTHLEWKLTLQQGTQTIVPGKPITGKFRINFSDLSSVNIQGEARGASLLTLLEKGKPPIGNIPTSLTVKMQYVLGKGPTDMAIELNSAESVTALNDPVAPKILELKANGYREEGSDIIICSLNTSLDDLCATDIGERLELKNRLRGKLKGSASFVQDHRGARTFRISFSNQGEVYVLDINNPEQGFWLPTNLLAKLDANAEPNEQGHVSNIEVTEFEARSISVTGPSSFSVRSIEPNVSIRNWDKPEKLSINGLFDLEVHGREFYREFAPILKLFSVEQSIEEIFNLKVTIQSETESPWKPREDLESTLVASRPRIVMRALGEIKRQWNEDPAPRDIYCRAAYFPQVTKDGKALPAELQLDLATGDEATPPYVRLIDMHVTMDRKTTVDIPLLNIEYDLAALKERFGPYLTRLFRYLGTDLYDVYETRGYLRENGSLKVMLGPVEKDRQDRALEVSFDLNLAGDNLVLEGPNPYAPDKKFLWAEPKLKAALKGNYSAAPSQHRGESLDKKILNLNKLKVAGKLGEFAVTVQELDLALWTRQQSDKPLPGKYLSDMVSAFAIDGLVRPEIFDLARRLQRLPGLPAASGQLQINLDFDRKQDLLNVRQLAFVSSAPPQDWWLKNLEISTSIKQTKKLFKRWAEQPKTFDFAGSVNFIASIGDRLQIKSLEIDTGVWLEWVKKYPEQAFDWGIGTELQEQLLAGNLRPEGIWRIGDLEMNRDANHPDTVILHGAFRHDLEYRTSALLGEQAGKVVIVGPWRIEKEAPLALSLSSEVMGISGPVNLTPTTLQLSGFLPEMDYVKPADLPLLLSFNGSTLRTAAAITYMGGCALLGGPFEFSIEGINYVRRKQGANWLEAIKVCALDKFELKGGAMPLQLNGLEYLPEENRFACHLKIPKLDLQLTDRYLRLENLLPRQLSLSGQIKNLEFLYKGALDRLLSRTPDPKLDHLILNAELADPVLGTRIEDRQLFWDASGKIRLNLNELNGQLRLNLAAIETQVEGPPRRELHALNLPQFSVIPAIATESLPQALFTAAPRISLSLLRPLIFESPVDWSRLDSIWNAMLPTLGLPEQFDLRGLRVSGQASAPRFTVGKFNIEHPKLSGMKIENKTLSYEELTGETLDGSVAINTGTWNFGLQPSEHAQRIAFEHISLAKLLSDRKATSTDSLAPEGRLSMQGSIQGKGGLLEPEKIWEGELDLKLEDFAFGKGADRESIPDSLPAWLLAPSLDHGARWSLQLDTSTWINNEAEKLPLVDQIFHDLTLQFAVAARMLDLPTERFEWAPVTLQLRFADGKVQLLDSVWSATGTNQGLQLKFTGNWSLAPEQHEANSKMSIVGLPASILNRWSVELWPQTTKAAFDKDLPAGKFDVKLERRERELKVQTPLPVLRNLAQEVAFGVVAPAPIATQEALQFLYRAWRDLDAGTERVAWLLNQVGIALPGTELEKRLGPSPLRSLIEERLELRNEFSRVDTLAPAASLKKFFDVLDRTTPGATAPLGNSPPQGAGRSDGSSNKNAREWLQEWMRVQQQPVPAGSK